MDKKLEVIGVKVTVGEKRILQDIDLTLKRGEVVAVVGESGSGKTTLSRVLTGLIPFQGEVLVGRAPMNHRHIGREVVLVPQNSMNAFNPSIRMGKQLIDGVLLHRKSTKDRAEEEALALMETFNLSRECYSSYPHQLSGGMKQRMAFIMGILTDPDFLILDEVTTGLDKSNKGIILEKLDEIRKSKGILLISHEIDLVREVADRVIVLKNGIPAEWGPCREVLTHPRHPYVSELINSLVENLSEDLTPLRKLRSYRDSRCCPFIEYCSHAMNICTRGTPSTSVGKDRGVACWIYHMKEGENK